MIDAEWMRFIGWELGLSDNRYSMSHFNENKGLFVYPPKKGHLKGHRS